MLSMSGSCNSMDCGLQAPLSMGFPRQEYWSGLPFPSPGDLSDPGIKHTSLASPVSPTLAGRFFTSKQRSMLKASQFFLIFPPNIYGKDTS